MRLLYTADGHVDGYLVKALREAGHLLEVAEDAADAAEMARIEGYEAIVLDWAAISRPALAELAAASDALVVVIAGPRNGAGSEALGEAARAAALAAGADACLVRPLEFIELEARLEALDRLVRRARHAQADVEILPARQALRLGGRTVALSPRELRLMSYFVARAGEVIDVEQLHRQGWGEASEPRPDLVRACLARLRRKLGDAGSAGPTLRVVIGHGYVFGGERPTPISD